MVSNEFCKMMLDFLIEGKDGQQKARDLLLQSAFNVEQALRMLIQFECAQQRISQDVMLKFVVSLPQSDWVVFACDLMLQKSLVWDKCAVAVILRKVMATLTRRALMLAEICWIRHLSSGVRAIASSAPVTITSAIDNNHLYVAGEGYMHDKCNWSVFCWKGQWTPDNKKELWQFVPVSVGSSDFYILNVYADAYIYASEFTVITDVGDCTMKRVLVSRYKKCLPDAAGIWRLVALEGNWYSFYNAATDAILCSPTEAPDDCRRGVATRTFRPLDETRSKCHEWKITSVTSSKLETGLVAFFAKNYDKAARTCTEILTMDHISDVDRAKLLCYRMVANLMLNNIGCFEQDWTEAKDLNKSSQLRFDILCECLSSDERKIVEERVPRKLVKETVV
ncbi:unnamed protein product [Peronospora belbahrii]|uniref:Uncharacterized protein n=1 Tax=Peronospora belbahrii TaxID=622444 RepID=A0AAU9L7Q7_9STRA|nr:unnamed protein product [Peronospora belbahrii]